ncbi:MAG: AAA family ATPase [Pyrinomonadaceae bacterium]
MSSIDIKEVPALRKANDVFAPGIVCEPTYLFDTFWREGEVALLFGEHGIGKSFMAVSIAEALARGRPFDGLSMPETRRNVLYVDLVLSDAQFGYRYSCEGRNGRRTYRFSANFYRDSPREGQSLIEWLRVVIEREKINVVIIDDLSVVSRTEDGTQQALELIRELRGMVRRFGISALVLADSHPYVHNRETAERDLRRRRVLCAHADSVFALSAIGAGSIWRQLVQTRTQGDDIEWPRTSPAHFKIRSHDGGFVGLDFVEVELSEEERQLICRIKEMRDGGAMLMPFRAIGDDLGISKSKAARLFGKWKPSLEPPDYDDDEEDEYEDEFEEDDGPDDPDDPSYEETGEDREYARAEFDWSSIPFAAGLRRPSILDLERDLDHNGNPIYVESRRDHDHKPAIWYQYGEKSKTYTRWERKTFATSGKNVGPSHYLERARPLGFTAVARTNVNEESRGP